MICNPMFESICDIYSTQYGNCSDRNVCLVDLLGVDELMRKCKHVGLDKEYPELYKEIENNMKVRGEK